MFRSDVISDDLWAVIEPVLPTNQRRRGRPWNDHRRTLEAIAWRFRTGSPWRDLPEQFGAWQSIWERHRRWSTDEDLHQNVRRGPRLRARRGRRSAGADLG